MNFDPDSIEVHELLIVPNWKTLSEKNPEGFYVSEYKTMDLEWQCGVLMQRVISLRFQPDFVNFTNTSVCVERWYEWRQIPMKGVF